MSKFCQKIVIFNVDFFIVFYDSEWCSITLMTNPDLPNQNMLSECGYFIIWCQKMSVKVGGWKMPIFCSADCSWILKWWNNQDFAPDFKSGLILPQKRPVLPKIKNCKSKFLIWFSMKKIQEKAYFTNKVWKCNICGIINDIIL